MQSKVEHVSCNTRLALKLSSNSGVPICLNQFGTDNSGKFGLSGIVNISTGFSHGSNSGEIFLTTGDVGGNQYTVGHGGNIQLAVGTAKETDGGNVTITAGPSKAMYGKSSCLAHLAIVSRHISQTISSMFLHSSF